MASKTFFSRLMLILIIGNFLILAIPGGSAETAAYASNAQIQLSLPSGTSSKIKMNQGGEKIVSLTDVGSTVSGDKTTYQKKLVVEYSCDVYSFYSTNDIFTKVKTDNYKTGQYYHGTSYENYATKYRQLEHYATYSYQYTTYSGFVASGFLGAISSKAEFVSPALSVLNEDNTLYSVKGLEFTSTFVKSRITETKPFYPAQYNTYFNQPSSLKVAVTAEGQSDTDPPSGNDFDVASTINSMRLGVTDSANTESTYQQSKIDASTGTFTNSFNVELRPEVKLVKDTITVRSARLIYDRYQTWDSAAKLYINSGVTETKYTRVIGYKVQNVGVHITMQYEFDLFATVQITANSMRDCELPEVTAKLGDQIFDEEILGDNREDEVGHREFPENIFNWLKENQFLVILIVCAIGLVVVGIYVTPYVAPIIKRFARARARRS